MIRAFLDSSVFFSACFSSRGASREILLEGRRGAVSLVVSDVVLEEVEENLSSAPRAMILLDAFHYFLRTVPLETVQATERGVLLAARYTELKHAPIVAAARRAHVDYLVSLDRRHLVDVPEVALRSSLKIILPGALLEHLRR